MTDTRTDITKDELRRRLGIGPSTLDKMEERARARLGISVNDFEVDLNGSTVAYLEARLMSKPSVIGVKVIYDRMLVARVRVAYRDKSIKAEASDQSGSKVSSHDVRRYIAEACGHPDPKRPTDEMVEVVRR